MSLYFGAGFFYDWLMTHEEQLIELETKIAFLEKHFQELSDTVAAQAREIQALDKHNKIITEKLKALLTGEEISSDFERPPHY